MRTDTLLEPENGSGSVSSAAADGKLGSYTFDQLEIGLSESFEKTVEATHIQAFADLTGDVNPLHIDPDYAADTQFGVCISHGAMTGSMLSTIFGTKLPGIGSIYVSQTYNFRAPVKTGDHVVATVTVRELIERKNRVIFDCVCRVGETDVLTGEAVLIVPSAK